MEYRDWEDLSALEKNACLYSDMYKDAYGFRPRGNYPETEEEYEKAFASLSKSIEYRMEEDRAFEEASIDVFEENIEAMLSGGAGDRDTAIRWIAEAEGFYGKYDVEGYTYALGFGGSKYGMDLVEKIDSLITYPEYAER